jgi:transcription factor C subunit 6
VTVDHENMVKSFSSAPSMLGRGHALTEPRGPVWVRSWFLLSLECLH